MKNWNKVQIFLLIGLAALVLIGCGEEKPPIKKVETPGFSLDLVNKELDKYPVTGFPYKNTDPSKANWDETAKLFVPYVKTVVANMPEGYILEVRGHSDSSGPEEAVGKKKGNLYWSKQRAENLMNGLINQGIPKEKMKATGVGSKENIPDPNAKCLSPNNCRSEINRRVTFHVVKQ